MIEYRADLHIHTVLSPCADLEMSPINIVKTAIDRGLDIIGVSDHNTTRHCRLMRELAEERGLFVLTGAEVNTREEIHCLAFFESINSLDLFQHFLDENLPEIHNDPVRFGYQVQVDRDENIVYEEPKMLFSALTKSFDEIRNKVKQLEGIFIPAHIDRPRNSIYSQLGLLPQNLDVDALEISRKTDPKKFIRLHPEIEHFTKITSSDAHYPEDIGTASTTFILKEKSFSELKKALSGVEGRKVSI